MRTTSRLVAGLGITLGIGLLTAAGLQPAQTAVAGQPLALPCITIQEIETDSVRSFALWIGEVNEAIKAKFQLDTYRHVFVGESAGPECGVAFVVTQAESFAALTANEMAFAKEAELLEARLHMNQIRKLRSNVSYKAVRFGGAHPGGAVMNTKAVLIDEVGYLLALDALRTLFDEHGFKDVHVNCYRIAAGRTEWTHLISLNCPSRERRAQLMDAMQGEAWAQEWIAKASRFRTTVSNGTYREITPATAPK